MKNQRKLKPFHLREIAKKYFINKFNIGVYFGICRICRNLENHFGEQWNKYCWYIQMEQLMEEIGYHGCNFSTEKGDYQLGDMDQWQSRAWMCLFLAEYLETK